MTYQFRSLARWGALLLAMSACSVYDASLLEGRRTAADASAGGSQGVSTTTSETETTSSTSVSSVGGSSTSSSSNSTGGAGGDGGSGKSSQSAGGGTESSSSGGVGGAGLQDCETLDCCPSDPDKVDPGQCGCDVPDSDSDSDGFADCVDGCPDDANKEEPGACGCGIPDEDGATGTGCVPLQTGLVHRYSFEGTGNRAADGRGYADGTIMNAALDASGALLLNDGADDQYVELPGGLVSELTNASVEVWFVWDGGPMWSRLFDFGSTVEGVAGQPGTGATFLLFTPRGPDGPDYPYLTFYNGDIATEAFCSGAETLSSGEAHHLVVSLDTDKDVLTLYLDGAKSCAKALYDELDSLDDVNNWIGRSQFESDAPFVGSIDEFRIYDIALSAEQATFSFEQGANPAFLDD